MMTAPTPSASNALRPMQGLAEFLRMLSHGRDIGTPGTTLRKWAIEVEAAQQGQPASAVAVQPGEAVTIWNALDAAAKSIYNDDSRETVREFLMRAWHHNVCPALNAAAPVQASVAPSDDYEERLRAFQASRGVPPQIIEESVKRARANGDIPPAPPSAPQPFGWLFEGPQGVRQFSKGSDCIKPVLDLHRRMAQEKPEYTLTALYTRPEAAPAEQRMPLSEDPRLLTNEELHELFQTTVGGNAFRDAENIQRKFIEVNAGCTIPLAIEAAHGIQEAKNAVGGQGGSHG